MQIKKSYGHSTLQHQYEKHSIVPDWSILGSLSRLSCWYFLDFWPWSKECYFKKSTLMSIYDKNKFKSLIYLKKILLDQCAKKVNTFHVM